jgi:hypothetical protein
MVEIASWFGDLNTVVANFNQANRAWLSDGSAVFTLSSNALGSAGNRGVVLAHMN